MPTYRLITQVVVIMLLAAFPGCRQDASPASTSNESLFFSSFEDIKDLSQWFGVRRSSLRSDTPPAGGELSAFVSDAFVLPRAYSEFGPFKSDVNMGLR